MRVVKRRYSKLSGHGSSHASFDIGRQASREWMGIGSEVGCLVLDGAIIYSSHAGFDSHSLFDLGSQTFWLSCVSKVTCGKLLRPFTK